MFFIHRLAAAMLTMLPLAVSAAANVAELNQVLLNKSHISFVSKQMGVPVDGRFKKFSAQILFDPAKAESGSAQIEVDLASVDTGSQEADDEVKSKNWFHVRAHPTARFVSSAVKPLGGSRYEISGKMTIKGRTRDVAAPVTLVQEGGNATLEGSFILLRTQFGIGEGPWADAGTVADEVQIRFKFVASTMSTAATPPVKNKQIRKESKK